MVELDFSNIPIYDQGDLACSAAIASAYAMMYMLANPPKEPEFLYFKVRPVT